MEQKLREYTFTWNDPRDVQRAIAGRPHLEWMADLVGQRLDGPPWAQVMGYSCDSVEPGKVRFSVEPAEWTANPAGVVHGGFTTALLDTVMTLVVVSLLPPEKSATTLDLQIHFVRPAVAGSGKLVAEASAVHVGSNVGTAEGRVTDDAGRLIAHGTSTMAILSPRLAAESASERSSPRRL
jgi:uncharacterized protein (TIGR00369 family)